MANRSVKPLSQAADQEFRLLYPVDPVGEQYQFSETMTLYRAVDVQEITLPARIIILNMRWTTCSCVPPCWNASSFIGTEKA